MTKDQMSEDKMTKDKTSEDKMTRNTKDVAQSHIN
jgi:hypothetical protein